MITEEQTSNVEERSITGVSHTISQQLIHMFRYSRSLTGDSLTGSSLTTSAAGVTSTSAIFVGMKFVERSDI